MSLVFARLFGSGFAGLDMQHVAASGIDEPEH